MDQGEQRIGNDHLFYPADLRGVEDLMLGVLIIEDDANIRKFTTVNLQARGYDVTAVDNAEDGLEHLRHEPTDILLLDLKLPGIPWIEYLGDRSRRC